MIGRRTKRLGRTMPLCDLFLTKSKGRVNLRSGAQSKGSVNIRLRAQGEERVMKSPVGCAASTESGRILSQRRRFSRPLRDERFQEMRMIAKPIVSWSPSLC